MNPIDLQITGACDARSLKYALKGQPARSPGQSEAAPWVKGTHIPFALKGQKHKNNYMAQSLSKIYVHLIFHIKTTSPQICEEDSERVHAYIGQLVNNLGCRVIQTGGVEDHVHTLFLLSKNESISHVVEELKRNSSRWIKTINSQYERFEWQSGYGAFSVSQSVVDKTVQYIKNQKTHHQKHSFRDEYLEFLKLYGISFDDRYVFTD